MLIGYTSYSILPTSVVALIVQTLTLHVHDPWCGVEFLVAIKTSEGLHLFCPYSNQLQGSSVSSV